MCSQAHTIARKSGARRVEARSDAAPTADPYRTCQLFCRRASGPARIPVLSKEAATMSRRLASLALGVLVVGSIGALLRAQAGPAAPARPISFARDVEPILDRSCRSCHGDTMQMGKLDLRTRDSAMRGGAHGPVLVPSSADASRPYRMVAGLEQPAMPMQGTLTPADVATLKAWIDQGARC